jgi:hypothetical protein
MIKIKKYTLISALMSTKNFIIQYRGYIFFDLHFFSYLTAYSEPVSCSVIAKIASLGNSDDIHLI